MDLDREHVELLRGQVLAHVDDNDKVRTCSKRGSCREMPARCYLSCTIGEMYTVLIYEYLYYSAARERECHLNLKLIDFV
jgi:hypothetical protein